MTSTDSLLIMYTRYFGLIDPPFSIAPNPQYLYMSERHREALAHLLYGVDSHGGFVLLTGEVGTGKTTVCRCMLQELAENVDTAFILNPKLTTTELLAAICDDLKIAYPEKASIKLLVDELHAYLLKSHANNRKTVVIIDEAQNLSTDVLEQLRLLTNLETNQRKLLQIILVGQPELLSILARKELRQLSQRITARFHLQALSKDEVVDYVHHRLAIAGGKGTLFPLHVLKRIYKFSGGVPRLINLICDRSLLGTYTQNRLQVNSQTVDQAAEEIFGKQPQWATKTTAFLVGITLIASVTSIGWNISANLSSERSILAAGVSATASGKALTTEEAPLPAKKLRSATAETIAPAVTSRVAIDIIPIAVVDSVDEAAAMQTGSEPLHHASPMPVYADLQELLLQSWNQNASIAFHDLFSIWGTDYPVSSTTNPCDVAISVGLRCWHRLGSLRDIKHLDRPVILVVTDRNRRTLYITMSQHSSNAVTLIINGSPHLVHTDEMQRHWDGRYTLLWRMPPEYRRASKLGDQGVEIDWLEEQLTRIQNRSARTTLPLIFDAEMQQQVKQFQMSTGLLPDGIVGFQTWIHINSHNGVGIPYLATRREG